MHPENDVTGEGPSVYLIGSGIASLASAVYLMKDAGIQGDRIHILEKAAIAGGALDGAGDAKRGFLVRGGRMHEIHYECFWDLLSNIPSPEDKEVSLKDAIFGFNAKFSPNPQLRLLRNGVAIDVSSYGLNRKQQSELIELMFASEEALGKKRIEDWFDPDFFNTNFWLIWCTTFAFQKSSSLAEMRRYLRRFVHMLDGLYKLEGVIRTRYNQYDSIVLPLKKYLEERGVSFHFDTEVTDIDFDMTAEGKTATVIHLEEKDEIKLGGEDYVFITNGSLTESTDNGTWERPPRLKGIEESGSWKLWQKIAAKGPAFGDPDVFCADIDRQKWYSFTVTMKDGTFLDHMLHYPPGNLDGTGVLVTLTDSNWLMTFIIGRLPHFPNQPDGVDTFWGYGLYPDRQGNYVDKAMAECSGEEILLELWNHLGIRDKMRPVMEAGKVNCIPVALPFVNSLFMPRLKGDRPEVIPEGARNFAFLGQFTEAPNDCVFTVEYSVRTAQMAVCGLFETGKEAVPVYDSIYEPDVLIKAVQAISR